MPRGMIRVRVLGPVLGAVLGLVLGLGPGSAPQAYGADHTVRIEGMKFVPASVVVAPGDTVTWVNADFLPHTVTARAAKVESGDIAASRRWTFTAGAPGRLDYICRLHPVMRGIVIIQAKR
jgi:plastocyanin